MVATLVALVDYDNVDARFTSAGAIPFARTLLTRIPLDVVRRYESATVRLYGGWRANNARTPYAQRLLAEILRDSPTVYQIPSGPKSQPTRIFVELADRPIGSNAVLVETLVKNRTLRRFRANPDLLRNCVDIQACAMQPYFLASPTTACSNAACGEELGSLLVRDEQKMVDTLLVADIASAVFMQQAADVVVVSSDSDIWPGVLLSLRGGCNVVHVHPKPGQSTPPHLLRTIDHRAGATYTQLRL